jgi:hypothetical protein
MPVLFCHKNFYTNNYSHEAIRLIGRPVCMRLTYSQLLHFCVHACTSSSLGLKLFSSFLQANLFFGNSLPPPLPSEIQYAKTGPFGGGVRGEGRGGEGGGGCEGERDGECC